MQNRKNDIGTEGGQAIRQVGVEFQVLNPFIVGFQGLGHTVDESGTYTAVAE